MRFFDSHAHLSSLDEIKRAKEHLVEILNIATDEESLNSGLNFFNSEKVPLAAAVTPYDAHEESSFFEKVQELAKNKKLVAIGETGLEYALHKETSLHQKKSLEKHVALAESEKLPLIIHCREAFQDLFSFLEGCKTTIILHCFTGTLLDLEIALKRNWFISISGIVTFSKGDNVKLAAKETPLNRLLLETDAPFLTPEPFRGQKNESAYLPLIAKKVAEIKQITIEEVALYTSNNAENLFLNFNKTLSL